MSSVSGFTGKSNVYSQFRPSYPRECLNFLKDELGLSGLCVADIGCGTGIFTVAAESFASLIYGIDCNDDMLNACRQAASGHNKIKIFKGQAENTGLPNQCVDAVVAAQSFHFFDGEAFKAECKRILRPKGQIVLMWNSLLEGDFVERLGKLSGPKFKKGLLAGNHDTVAGFFTDDRYIHRVFPNFQPQTREMFVGRYLSSSHAPKKDDERYQEYVENLNLIFDDYQINGIFDHPYHTLVYAGVL